MAHRKFILQLLLVTAFSGLVLFGLHQIDRLQPYGLLSLLSIGMFVLLSIIMYVRGRKSAHSDNKNEFTNTVMGFTMGKMFLSIVIIYGYLKVFEPGDKLFIVPFFTVYLIYTAFEIYFMMKLGRMNV